MQLTSRYLATNKTVLVLDEWTGTLTEYRKVYNRQLKIIKGIDNVLTFEIKNNNQKPVSILNTYTAKFQAFDQENTLVLSKTGTIKETATPNYKGQFTVNITDNDTLNLDGQYLTYFVHLVDNNNNNVVTYADAQFDAKGTIELDTGTLPGPKDPYKISQFTEISTDVFASEAVQAEPALNGNEALHTTAIYTTGYTGDVTIQATLENLVDSNTNWVDVSTTSIANPTEPKYINFNGVFSWIRIKHAPTAGTIDKVLIRN